MRQVTVTALLAAVLILAGCGTGASRQEAATTTVDIAGSSYRITQLTASTWTVVSSSSGQTLNGRQPGQAALRAAVEKASGCKISDSDYSQQGLQFDAQVDCGSRLKN